METDVISASLLILDDCISTRLALTRMNIAEAAENWPDFYRFQDEAINRAFWLGGIIALSDSGRIRPIPAMLDGYPLLEESFYRGAEHCLDRMAEEEAQAKAAENARRRQECLAERVAAAEHGDWASIDLPTPAEAMANIRNGQLVSIELHAVHIDQDGIWMTNPYGLDVFYSRDTGEESLTKLMLELVGGKLFGQMVPRCLV